MTGLDSADGQWVFLVDSDQQIPMAPFANLWEAVEGGADAAFGVRRRRYDPRMRLMLTFVIRHTLRLLFGGMLYDANVPYKLVARSAWLDARKHIPDGTLAPSLFLAMFLKRRGAKIVEMDVPHRERDTGEVSIRRWKLVKFCARGLSQLWTFRKEIRQ